MIPEPHRVRLPLRLGPHDFYIWAMAFGQRGIDVYDVFDIESHTVSAGRLTGTEYIIKNRKP